ncbi:MAG: beta-galactosidase [Candidatus Brocadiia bacterium]
MTKLCACLLLFALAAAPVAGAAPELDPDMPLAEATQAVRDGQEYIWIEGEDASVSMFSKHPWYHDVLTMLLSERDWLSHYAEGVPGVAHWRFRVQVGGTYTWWLRCNVSRMQQHYSLDGGQWQLMDLQSDVRGQAMLSRQIDHRFIGWVKGGTFELSPGDHVISIRTSSDIANHGGVDCMCLVNFPWAPAGTQKPEFGEARRAGPDVWFPVMPHDDPFSDESITDVSHLLHRPAGSRGFVQTDGRHFVFSERPDEPVKFWGCAAGPARGAELQRRQARLYARHGINMVRKHTVQAEIGLLQTDPQTGERHFDPQRLDRFDRWFSILKKNGIYMTWSCFYPHVITPQDGYPEELYQELPDRGAGKSTSGLVNFMRPLQDSEWEWLKTLLEHRNPYTGLRYADDPALAIVEVHNEDCIFWHAPLNDLAAGQKYPRHTAVLKRMWMEWLAERYGSDEALHEAWQFGMHEGDSIHNPDMDIYGAWQFSAEGPDYGEPVGVKPGERRRMGDFIRFLAETQRSYYERRYRRLRELGYKAAIVSTAWRAGGPAADPANVWCDSAMDLITRHNYFGGGAGGHNIRVGEVNNETHMGQPGSHLLSTGFYQVEDKPFIITEWTQKPPNQWKAEAAPLFALYGMCLQGWDGSYHFAGGRPRMGSGWPGERSYVTETPHYLGQFPALAIAVYNRHVQEAPIAAARRLETEQVFQGFDALSQDFSGGGYDQKELRGNLATPKEVLAIGRVTLKIAEDVAPAVKADWQDFWDKTARVVRSMTGELVWDYGNRVVTVRSPKTQGVIGFAGGGDYELPAAQVTDVKTPFVSLLLTPLDEKPLAESRHILVTAMARDKQTGAEYNEDGTELLSVGLPPLLMEPVQATIALEGPPIGSVRVVDIYGVPTDRTVPVEANTFSIDGRYETYYYEVRR